MAATRKKRRGRKRRVSPRFFVVLTLFAAVVVLCVVLLKGIGQEGQSPISPTPGTSAQPGIEETPQLPEVTPPPPFNPLSQSEETSPDHFGIQTAIKVNGETVNSYSSDRNIDFLTGDEYTQMEGIITFRGNNFRNTASYGTADIVQKKFDTNYWTYSTGSMPKKTGSGSWTGSGWTGQPLIVKWPEETKKIMKMYDSAKNKQGLVEVIYATLDGHIYFLDLETGEKTRDPINVGFPFKGAGALDPRGIPIMYVGAGDHTALQGGKNARAFIISLVDNEVLYEFGNDDEFSLRKSISFFDSSPLVDADTDTLIWPGENGILYLIRLNTDFNPAGGTLNIQPEVVRWRYKGARSDQNGKYWLGMEDSIVIWRGHGIFTDNGGHMICLDLNTLEVKWVQDTLDDTNCTPVLSIEDGRPFVYTSTSFHAGWRADEGSTATIPIWKIDAVTGEIVWHVDYQCRTVKDVSGGVQGTIAIGQQGLEGMIFVPISRTPSGSTGILAAIDTDTGNVIWEFEMDRYPWSSPVCVYDKDGKGYILQANQGGDLYLIDGLTKEVCDKINLGGNIEASPAVYEGTLVVGTRLNIIAGVKIN